MTSKEFNAIKRLIKFMGQNRLFQEEITKKDYDIDNILFIYFVMRIAGKELFDQSDLKLFQMIEKIYGVEDLDKMYDTLFDGASDIFPISGTLN